MNTKPNNKLDRSMIVNNLIEDMAEDDEEEENKVKNDKGMDIVKDMTGNMKPKLNDKNIIWSWENVGRKRSLS